MYSTWKYTFTAFALFILLTPRVLVSLPPGSKNKYLVAFVHAIVFAAALYLFYTWEEGFQEKKYTTPSTNTDIFPFKLEKSPAASDSFFFPNNN